MYTASIGDWALAVSVTTHKVMIKNDMIRFMGFIRVVANTGKASNHPYC